MFQVTLFHIENTISCRTNWILNFLMLSEFLNVKNQAYFGLFNIKIENACHV